jgi:erythritol transport system ATP-binding protein
MMQVQNAPICLKAEHITKIYPGIKALDDVSFNVYQGKVNVLVGENGAGKSTLMKIIAGIEQPTDGTIKLARDDGSFEEIKVKNTLEAKQKGIGIINQELSLFPNLNVYQNIFMNQEKLTKQHTLDDAEHAKEADEILKKLRHPIPVDTLVGTLRIGQQQIIEIAKNLVMDNLKILIMDEPTSSLSKEEVDVLFGVMRELTHHGISIIYISHRLEEIMEIGDYIEVLRDGKYVADASVKDINLKWIIRSMVGTDMGYARWDRGIDWSKQPVVMEVKHISLPKPGGGYLLNDVSFVLKKSEILGIYGLMGAGRTELFECIMGLRPEHTGQIFIDGQLDNVKDVSTQIQNGIVLVPEDRQSMGLVQCLDIERNFALSSLRNYTKHGVIDEKTEDEATERQIKDIQVKVADKHLPIFSLSGGNQQKVVIGKGLLTHPKIFLLDEPTRGIDVGAKAEIFEIIRRNASKGLSIIVISSELKEIMAISDRVVVLSKGIKAAELVGDEITEENLVLASYKGHTV